MRDADDAVRLVSGLLRRGESGEAFRERIRTETWTASESGLLAPALAEESGTAVRIRREGSLLLVARSGAGPEALRDAVREAGRRAGSAPFFKAHRGAAPPPGPHAPASGRTRRKGARRRSPPAFARALPDPRGLTLSVEVSRVVTERTVVTPRALLPCGVRTRLVASGTIRRAGSERPFSFQSARPFGEAADALAAALREATRPVVGPSSRARARRRRLLPFRRLGLLARGRRTRPRGRRRRARLGALAREGGRRRPARPRRRRRPGPERPPGRLRGRRRGDARPRRAAPRRAASSRDSSPTGAPGAVDTNGHGRTSSFRRPPRVRMSNLVASAGEASLDELLERCGDGLYVREVASGSADPESGRFVLLVSAADARAARTAGRAARPLRPDRRDPLGPRLRRGDLGERGPPGDGTLGLREGGRRRPRRRRGRRAPRPRPHREDGTSMTHVRRRRALRAGARRRGGRRRGRRALRAARRRSSS